MNKKNHAGRFLIVAGLLLILGAAGLTGYNVLQARSADRNAQQALETLYARIPQAAQEAQTAPDAPASAPDSAAKTAADLFAANQDVLHMSGVVDYPDYVLNPNIEMPETEIDGNMYIGVLKIPSQGLELPVMSKWDYAKLRLSPCRYVGSVYLNNMVICAHNYDRHFGRIKNLQLGDELSFTDVDGNVFSYRVIEVETLKPRASEEMKNGDWWDLTLFTCTLGGATRITVRCERI